MSKVRGSTRMYIASRPSSAKTAPVVSMSTSFIDA